MNKPEYNSALASNLFDVEIAARLKNKENCQNTFLICGSNDNQGAIKMSYCIQYVYQVSLFKVLTK